MCVRCSSEDGESTYAVGLCIESFLRLRTVLGKKVGAANHQVWPTYAQLSWPR